MRFQETMLDSLNLILTTQEKGLIFHIQQNHHDGFYFMLSEKEEKKIKIPSDKRHVGARKHSWNK